MSSSVICGATVLRFAIESGSTNGTGAGTSTGINMLETSSGFLDGADVIPLPQILDDAVFHIGGCTSRPLLRPSRIFPPLHASLLHAHPSYCTLAPLTALARLSAHLLPSACLSHLIPPVHCILLSPHPLPIPAFYSSPCPSSPLVTHTNPLPKPPTSRPTPAYLAACFGVSHTTLGKILLHVMSARARHTPQNRARRDPREAADGDWLWPALWILPVDDAYGGWTLSGEIDIMEARGNEPLYPKQGINYV
ncbi:hypothetical protein C8J57DRAFT_1725669, partial [Mycena rebaudengoi]